MGSRQSTTAFNKDNFREGIRGYQKMFESLQLEKRELRTLWIEFGKIDQDGSGTITIRELLDHCDLDRTPFAYRLFGIFDEDNSGSVDFREFVLSTWNCCTMDRDSLVRFAFDLFDVDRSGMMEEKEVELLLREVYSKSFDDNPNALQALERVRELSAKNKQGTMSLSRPPQYIFGGESYAISFEAFREFCRQHAGVLLPAFTLQRKVRSKIVSEKFWKANRMGHKNAATTTVTADSETPGASTAPEALTGPVPGATRKTSNTKGGGAGNRLDGGGGDDGGRERNATGRRRSLEATAPKKQPMQGKVASNHNKSGHHPKVARKKPHSGHRDEKGDGSGKGKTSPVPGKRWSNCDRVVAAIEADLGEMSGPAKRARIRSNAASQAKPVLSVDSRQNAEGRGAEGFSASRASRRREEQRAGESDDWTQETPEFFRDG